MVYKDDTNTKIILPNFHVVPNVWCCFKKLMVKMSFSLGCMCTNMVTNVPIPINVVSISLISIPFIISVPNNIVPWCIMKLSSVIWNMSKLVDFIPHIFGLVLLSKVMITSCMYILKTKKHPKMTNYGNGIKICWPCVKTEGLSRS